MANIAKRADGRWRARYRDTAGTEYARHFPRRVGARSWLDSVTTAVGTGSYVDPRAPRSPVGTMAEQLFARKINLRATTGARYEAQCGST
jgi:hypothetical protein